MILGRTASLLLTAVATAAAWAASRASADAGADGLVAVQLQIVLNPCRKSAIDSEIVVCGRARDRSPYRLPAMPEGFDPEGPVDSVSRERHRLMEGGEAGIGSCSTVGPGGYTGCFAQAVRQRHQQRGGK